MRIDTLTPVIDAAPGEVVVGRFRLVNDGSADASYRLRVVGLENGDEPVPISGGVVSAGVSTEVEVPFQVPHNLGIGHHAVALEISSDQPRERPSLAQLTVAIESIERVALSSEPSTIRGRRRAKFSLDVVNHEPHTVDVSLVGSAPDVSVRLVPGAVQLHPGQRLWVRGRLRGPRRWFGEPRQHVVTFSARGRASATSTTAPYIQQPLVPFRLRNIVAALVVIALWLAAMGTVAWWVNGRDDEAADSADTAGQQTDADGDGVLDPLPDTADGGTPGADGQQPGGSGEGGDGGGGSASGAPPGLARKTHTVVKGTVTTGDTGDASGVDVVLAPIKLGEQPSAIAAFAGPADSQRSTVKLWPARFGSYDTGLGLVRQTESVLPLVTDVDGVWLFADVPIRQTYELTFSKPGYDTQSFVVAPAVDGSPWELDVELETADGEMSGTVLGPGGPLGGAAIVITDGTLTFTTTSDTTGDVGTFSVGGISTPGVYTLTSTLFGYGTEVLQVRLEPGEQRAGIDVRMRRGVGSISGRIFAEADPAGGITVTTSSGDAEFTTSTLTEGDVGFYNLPQLPIPGNYTVTVAADGFIPQTRQVVLNGAVGGVDFELVRTTARLTGMVTSSRGGPIVGAGITVLRDDLGFRSTTAAAPDAGSFSIDDLPPGTYVVRIERFDHLTFSTQVTVRAGQVLDLGTIELEFTSRPPLVETGSLTVRILDSTNAELTGATVSILPLDSNTPIATRSDDDNNQSSFIFESVGVGTYRVRATRDGYRPANVRVSVGLGPQTVDFRLFKLGQVSGRVVDSLVPDGDPGRVLGGYQITLSRVVGNIVTLIDTRTPELIDGEFVWESDPTLLAGVYEIGVPVPPPGYAVVPDQFIDPALVPPTPMRFLVPEDSDDPIRVGDIEADPYPVVQGFVYEPDLGVGDVVTLGRSDVPSLTVTLTCPSPVPGAPPVSAPATPLFLPGSPDPEVGGFFFSGRVIGDNGLVGACDLTFAAPGYRTRTVALDPPLAVSDGTQRTDRHLSVPMLTDIPQPLTGELFWTDRTTGDSQPVVGAQIASSGVIVDYAPRQASVETTEPLPVPGTLSATSAADGSWTMTGQFQVFGASTYTVTSVDFETASFIVRMDPVRQVVAGANLLVADTPAGPLSIELGNPRPGRIAGDVEIVSTKPVKPFNTVDVAGTGPGGATLDIDLPNQPAGTATQTFDVAAAAGSWTVRFNPPTRLVRFDDAADTVDPADFYDVGPELVTPNDTTPGFDITLLELGRIALTVDYTDTPGAPVPDPGTYTLTEPFGGTAVSAPAPQGTTPFDDLAVDLENPLLESTYTLDVERPGYDVAGAAVEVADDTAGPDPTPVPSTGSTRIEVGVAAGSDRSVTVDLEQYGTITGSVWGERWPDDPLSRLDFPAASIDARRCDADGGDLGTAGVVVTTGAPGTPSANEFVVSGPPGFYCIVASHPDFHSSFGPDGDADDIELGSGQWLFEIENTEPRTIGQHVLQVKRGTLNLDVVTDKATNTAVAGAEVTLFRQDTTTPIAGGPFLTDALGEITIPDLVPGIYDIEIRLHDATGNDLAFPVIATITIPGGPVDADRVVSVTAPLPLLQASIAGTVIAVNSVGEVQPPPPAVANQVAVPAAVTVTRTFLPSSLDVVTGTGAPATVPNEATDDDVDLAAPPVPPSEYTEVSAVVAADGLSSSFEFFDVAGGSHELAFSEATGYKVGVPATTEVTVAAVGTTPVGPFVYVAEDVDLTVTVTGAAAATFQNLTFTLTHGTSPTPIPGSLSGNVISFVNLPPSRSDYTLAVDDDLHDAQSVAITIVPDIDGVAGQAETVALTGDQARFTGQVSELFQPATGGPQTSQGISDGSIVVERLIGPTPADWEAVSGLVIDTDVDPDSPTPNPSIDYVVATGRFTFNVATPGDYRVRAQKDDQNTFTVATSNAFSVTLGQVTGVTPEPLVIVQRGRLTITTNPTGATVTVATSAGIPAPNTANVYFLTPGIQYTINVSATGYYDAAPLTRTLGIGATDSITVVLTTRTATVDVAGLTSGQSVNVTIAIPAGTTPPVQRSVTAGTGGTATVTFPTGSPFDANFLPLTGAGTLSVASPGYRTQTFPIADTDTTIDLDVTMRPIVTTISGTVVDSGGAAVEGATVLIEGTAVSTPTDAAGAFSLTNSAGFASLNLVASKLGTGRGPAAVTITSTSPTGNTFAVGDITLNPRNVTVVFTLNTAGSVTFDGTTLPATGTPATATFTDAVLENATGAALEYSASASGFLTLTGSISISAATGDAALSIAQPVTLVASPAISGNVQDSATPPVNVNSQARLHAGACPAAGTALATEAGFGDSTFGFPAAAVTAPGTYCVHAAGSGGTPTGTRQITVESDGDVTSGAASGALIITLT